MSKEYFVNIDVASGNATISNEASVNHSIDALRYSLLESRLEHMTLREEPDGQFSWWNKADRKWITGKLPTPERMARRIIELQQAVKMQEQEKCGWLSRAFAAEYGLAKENLTARCGWCAFLFGIGLIVGLASGLWAVTHGVLIKL